MKRLLFGVLFIAILFCVGCTDEAGARKTLEDQGYTNINFTGYRAFICGDDYTFHTGFTATSIAKRPVSGAVCSGWLKGQSIKLD